MGYNIGIGELIPANQKIEDDRPSVERVYLEDAPAYGELTDHTNERWPSYTGWGDFLEATDLGFLSPGTCHFPRDESCPPLMDEHPGVMPVLPIHLTVIEAKMAEYRKKIGIDIKPGWGPVSSESGDAEYPGYDGNLARLTWLHYWVKWALANCKKPVCVNT